MNRNRAIGQQAGQRERRFARVLSSKSLAAARVTLDVRRQKHGASMRKTRVNTKSPSQQDPAIATRANCSTAKTSDKLVPTTPKEIAEWMISQINSKGQLLQVKAVSAIEKKFGSEFVYVSDIGELSIDRRVLYQFRKMTADDIVWVTQHGGGFWPKAHWRQRGPGDSPGRTQYEY